MNRMQKKRGFTLLEIIIVIIIIGVMASIALPRFFAVVEYSRAVEAFVAIGAIRQSLERCYLQRATYIGCDNFASLDLEDPAFSPNAHFTYSFANMSPSQYEIIATRNALDGGSVGDTISLEQIGNAIVRSGTGAFSGIQ